jgi:hypothetical protein
MANRYVIVVAGIGGNELYVPTFDRARGRKIWVDYITLAVNGFTQMRLAVDGLHQYNPFGGDLLPGLVLGEFYGRISDYLAVSGYIPVSFEQDWRPRIRDVVGDLVRQITELSADGPVRIVCHSNGGLVVRQALAQMSAADRAARVGRVVGLGVPHYGSWSAVQMLAALNQLLLGLGFAIGPGPAETLLTGGVYRVPYVVGSWPTGYEMLPAPGAPGIAAIDLDRIYGPNEFRGLKWVRPDLIDEAHARWAAAPAVPADVSWLDVVGVGLQTPTRLVTVGGDPTRAEGYVYEQAGDGVVPSTWAVSGRGSVVETNADHSAMVGARAVHDAVGTWLGAG